MAIYRVASPTRAGLLLSLLLLTVPAITPAATIEQIGSSELVAEAVLIFQGEVYESKSRMARNGRIYTYVEFSVVDVLKGRVASNSLQLRFTGGTVGDDSLDVGVIIPHVGEHGIYFVESTDMPLANPLLGWAQGHFVVSEDNHVTAGDGGTVVNVEPQVGSQTMTLSTGVAAGFSTIAPRRRYGDHERPLTPEEFKARIRRLVENSKGESK